MIKCVCVVVFLTEADPFVSSTEKEMGRAEGNINSVLFSCTQTRSTSIHIWLSFYYNVQNIVCSDAHSGSRRVPKKTWTKAEVSAVMRHFQDHIRQGKLVTKSECSHCKAAEGSVLARRTIQNIRDFVRNRGLTAKRKSQKPN